jgi:hypothetical protein
MTLPLTPKVEAAVRSLGRRPPKPRGRLPNQEVAD